MPRILAIGSSSVSRTPLSLPPLGPEAGQTQEPFVSAPGIAGD